MTRLTLILAALLIAAGGLYVRLRWHRSPRAYRAMFALAACYFAAGSLTGVWMMNAFSPGAPVPAAAPPGSTTAGTPSVAAPPTVPTAPRLKESYTGPTFPIPPLHYDPVHAILPDPKLTPGDVFKGATKDDVCTPGWSREHRNVTESMRDQVYAEYGRTRGPGCCEVDHLIPLELGGSNDMKNLWPQPDDPRPGDAEKDSLENNLHARVCKGKLSLVAAQKCIAADWVKCWEKYVVPEYGSE